MIVQTRNFWPNQHEAVSALNIEKRKAKCLSPRVPNLKPNKNQANL